MRRPPAFLQKFVHFMTALTVLLKGVSKLDHPDGYELLIAFLFACAVYIVTITLLHDRLHRHERFLTASVLAIESVVTGIMAWLYVTEGKKGLPWLAASASVMFLVALLVQLVKTRGNAPHSDRVNGA
jgi:hypothetical protein